MESAAENLETSVGTSDITETDKWFQESAEALIKGYERPFNKLNTLVISGIPKTLDANSLVSVLITRTGLKPRAVYIKPIDDNKRHIAYSVYKSFEVANKVGQLIRASQLKWRVKLVERPKKEV